MVSQENNLTKQMVGNQEDMPHRVAPRLEGVVQNKGTKKVKKEQTHISK